MEKECSTLKKALAEVEIRVCKVKKIGNGRRKLSECYNEELENRIKRKNDAFNKYLGINEAMNWEQYKES